MKQTFILLGAIIFLFSGCNQVSNSNQEQPINPVIGDISFAEKFNSLPNQSTDDYTRIRTHLEYVENLLRQKDVSHLTDLQKAKREKGLDLLHAYWTAGNFPKNYDNPNQRKPCFIDKDGAICAVGYLVEQTAGRTLAEVINAKFKYATIYEMDLPALAKWVGNSGFTLEELATIQPTYGSQNNNNSYVEPEYAAASSVFGGINLATSAISLVNLNNPNSGKLVPAIGLISGSVSTTLGLLNLELENKEDYWNYEPNEGKKALSMVNIGLGTTTMFISAYQLLRKEKPEPKKLSWNVYSFPTPENQMSVGLGLTKRF